MYAAVGASNAQVTSPSADEAAFRALFKELMPHPAGHAESRTCRRRSRRVLADDAITITPTGEGGVQSPMPPLSESIVEPARKVAESIWPGVAIVPTMLPGYTDGKYLNPAGVPFEFAEGNSTLHGVLNERIGVQSLLEGRRFLYEVVKLYADSED